MFPVILNSLWPSQNQLWHIMVGQNIWKVNMDQRFSMLTATSILLLKVYKVFLKVTFRKIIYLPIYLSKAKSPEHIADSHILSISKYFSNRKKKKNTWGRLIHSIYCKSYSAGDSDCMSCPRLHRKVVITESRFCCKCFFYVLSPLVNSLWDRMDSMKT